VAKEEKALHQQVAEKVIAKVSPAIRKRLELTPKGSYSVVGDETGWVARITKSVVEFNSRRVEPADLQKAGMVKVGKDDWHRNHDLATAPAKDGEEAEATDAGPVVGVAEVAKAVGAAAKAVKS
jgi:hypothetical protein